MDLRKKLNQSYSQKEKTELEKEKKKELRNEKEIKKEKEKRNEPTDEQQPNNSRSAPRPFVPPEAPRKVGRPEYMRFDAPRTSLKAVVEGHTNRGYKKAAKLMLLLGKQDAAKVLEHFSKEEVEKILSEVAVTKKVEEVEVGALLQEFGLIKTTSPILKGGRQVAKDLLTSAFGEEAGSEMFRRIIPYEDDKPFQFLFDLDPQQIFFLLKKEPVPVVSMVLAHIPPGLSGKVIKYFDPLQRKDIIRRIGHLGKIDPDVISSTEEMLKERYRTQGKIVANEIDGKGRLAQILKHMPVQAEDEILKSLEDEDPDLSSQLKDKVYTVEMAYQLPRRDLSRVLRDTVNEDIAVLASARDSEFRDFILAHVSTRRRDLILQDMEYAGTPVPKEKDRVCREFVDILLRLREMGKISFKDEYI